MWSLGDRPREQCQLVNYPPAGTNELVIIGTGGKKGRSRGCATFAPVIYLGFVAVRDEYAKVYRPIFSWKWRRGFYDDTTAGFSLSRGSGDMNTRGNVSTAIRFNAVMWVLKGVFGIIPQSLPPCFRNKDLSLALRPTRRSPKCSRHLRNIILSFFTRERKIVPAVVRSYLFPLGEIKKIHRITRPRAHISDHYLRSKAR